MFVCVCVCVYKAEVIILSDMIYVMFLWIRYWREAKVSLKCSHV